MEKTMTNGQKMAGGISALVASCLRWDREFMVQDKKMAACEEKRAKDCCECPAESGCPDVKKYKKALNMRLHECMRLVRYLDDCSKQLFDALGATEEDIKEYADFRAEREGKR